jgi:arylsulfatase A-like enzyme
MDTSSATGDSARTRRMSRRAGSARWVVLAGLLVLVIAAIFLLRPKSHPPASSAAAPTPSGAGAAGPQAAEPPRGPNVLLISIDTLRPDHVGCYGYGRDTSPNLDRLAAEGVLFENHISSTSWTLPAHAALFTSLADCVHGCVDTDRRLPEELTTLAECFAAAGYETAGFFSGPYLHPAFGLGQGFAHYENCASNAKALDEASPDKWAMDPAVMRDSHRDITSPRVYAAFHNWLVEHQGDRFFAFVHLWDPHYDFIPPAPYNTKFDPDYHGDIDGTNFITNPRIEPHMPRRDLEHVIALYDGEIAWTDAHVGKILADLKQMNLLDETVIAVTSDHGTEFFEHNNKGHRTTLFDEVIRIPFILRYPAALPRGSRVHAQTRLIDVAPTLLELAGLRWPCEVMGRSLLPLARGEAAPHDTVAVSELFSIGREIRSIRTLNWKFHDAKTRNLRFFFDLTRDPKEQRPLQDFAADPGRRILARYEQTTAALDIWRERVASSPTTPTLPEEVRRQLESLGYIDK